MNELHSSLDGLIDRTRIVETIVRFANAFDTKDWATLRACLADTVAVDYSQFRGEPPATIAADAYVASRAHGLAALQTLHISTNHDVLLDGDRATCRSAYRIFRVDPHRPANENRLDTAGNYEHGLVRSGDGWLIDRIRQTVVVQDGNPDVHGAIRRNA